MKREWCQEKWTVSLDIKSQPHRPKSRRLRCPACKKRFMTVWQTCGDYWCWHEYLPPHKKNIETFASQQG